VAKRKNNGIDFSSLDFDLSKIWGKNETDDDEAEKDFIRSANLNCSVVCFESAQKMAKAIDLDQSYFCLLNGKFIFGDIFEALAYEKQLKPKYLLITTLGMSKENADSLVNLVDYLGCEHIDLIVSGYFAAMERRKNIPYMAQEFAGRPINVAVLSSHCKIALMETEDGRKIVFAGSANLSSSNSLENLMIFRDDAVYNYIKEKLTPVMRRFEIIHGETGEVKHIKRPTTNESYEMVGGKVNG
jgi:hypothetical protein